MKVTQLIPEDVLKKMQISFQYLKPFDKSKSVFMDKHVGIRKYQSANCAVYPPLKPISKII